MPPKGKRERLTAKRTGDKEGLKSDRKREKEGQQERRKLGEISLFPANESSSLLVAQPSGKYGRHVRKGA